MTTTADTPTLDEQIEAFADQLFGAALGTAELTVAYFGRKLGLYAALRDAPLAACASLHDPPDRGVETSTLERDAEGRVHDPPDDVGGGVLSDVLSAVSTG